MVEQYNRYIPLERRVLSRPSDLDNPTRDEVTTPFDHTHPPLLLSSRVEVALGGSVAVLWYTGQQL